MLIEIDDDTADELVKNVLKDAFIRLHNQVVHDSFLDLHESDQWYLRHSYYGIEATLRYFMAPAEAEKFINEVKE